MPWQDLDSSDIVISDKSTDRVKKLRDKRELTKWQADQFEKRLRKRYEETAQRTSHTKWASVTTDSNTVDSQSDDDIPRKEDTMEESGIIFAKNGSRLPPNIIDMVRLKDVNAAEPSGAVVRSIAFHPTSDSEMPLLMTAGLDKCLRFYSVGKDEESRKVHGIQFPKLPIYKASFLPDSNSVVATGRRSFFYTYDMVAGKVDYVPGVLGRDEKSWESHFVSHDGKQIAFLGNDGYIILIDPLNKQATGTLKLNGSVRSLVFTDDGRHLLASGSDGDITRWDTSSCRCIERFSNHDGTVTASLSISKDHFAAGAESGVVNLYDMSNPSSIGKMPIKSIMNIPTSVDRLRFNHDGQILAMSSRFSSDCLKLLHVPSRTVFSNWPTSKSPLNYVFDMDFSPRSRFLAVGNDKGRCLIYKLRHYAD